MASSFSLDVVSNDAEVPFESDAPHRSLFNLTNYLKSCLGGARNGTVSMTARNTNVAGSGTITLATCLANTVIKVNGVPFTAIASGTPVLGNGEFVISGTDAADATSLAAAINASTNTAIAGVVTASSTGSTGVVTVTATRKGLGSNSVTLSSEGVTALAVITPTSINANDTVTLNGTALTGKQQRATGTLTAATAVAGNTFSIRGYTFTGAVGASTPGALTFSIDTGDNACATDIAKQINAFGGLSDVVTATSTGSSGVVTIRAVDAGTAGNGIALTGTATVLAASAATLTGGIAVANNEYESVGKDTQVAVDLARAINASSTGAINTFVRALATATGTIVASSVDADDAFTIYVNGDSYKFVAKAGAAATGTLFFSKDTGDNETATSIAAQINAYSALSGLVFATSSTATVTVTALTSAAAATFSLATNDSTDLAVSQVAKGKVVVYSLLPGTVGNAITVATINGTRLPITSSLSRLGGGTLLSNEGTQASGTLTLASVLTAQTCEVNGVTLTAHTNTQANDQFTIAGDDTADAAALCLAINNSTTAGLADVIATSALGVVTVKARRPGIAGNAITMSSAQGTIVASAARLASGAAPTTVVRSGDRLASGSESSMSFTF